MKYIIICSFMLANVLVAYSQSKSEEITSLTKKQKDLEIELMQCEKERNAILGEARRQRMLIIAWHLSERSLLIQDKELAGLLALQAYRFNVNYGGYIYDNAVFIGLYHSLDKSNVTWNSTKEFKDNPKSDFTVTSKPNGVMSLSSSKQPPRELYMHQKQVQLTSISSSNKQMASIDESGLIAIWNLEDLNKLPRSLKIEKAIKKLTFSDDDTELRITFTDSSIKTILIDSDKLAAEVEKRLTRNLTIDEWNSYVALDLPYEKTIKSKP